MRSIRKNVAAAQVSVIGQSEKSIDFKMDTKDGKHKVKRRFDYVLLGNALVLVVFLDSSLGLVLFLHDTGETDRLPANAIASAAPAKEICSRGDHKRGIRRTADQTCAGCQSIDSVKNTSARRHPRNTDFYQGMALLVSHGIPPPDTAGSADIYETV